MPVKSFQSFQIYNHKNRIEYIMLSVTQSQPELIVRLGHAGPWFK